MAALQCLDDLALERWLAGSAEATAQSGAMVALVPTAQDAARLAIDGGEPPDELHLTLWYLGKAATIDAATREALANAVRSMVERRSLPVVAARAFGANHWNPDGEEPCWVLAVGDLPADQRPDGQENLAVVKEMMAEAWHDGAVPYEAPPQHTPWAPHICLAYSADTGLLNEVVKRVGPVTFDRIRLAFAGDVIDIPLNPPPAGEAASESALDKWLEAWTPEQAARHPRGPDGRFLSVLDRVKDAVAKHIQRGGTGDPFPEDEFTREHLRRAARALDIELTRGERRDSIADKLLDKLRGEENGVQELPAVPEPPRPRVSRPRRPAAQPRVTPRQREQAGGRAATVASLATEHLWREQTLAGRRRAALDIADAAWWQDDWDGAAELRNALRRYGRGDLSIEELRRVGDDIEARHHLRREGMPGDRVRYDPATMEPSTNSAEDGMRSITAGDAVEVTAPGYRYTGGRVEVQPVRTRVRPLGGRHARPEPPRPAPTPAVRPSRPKLMLDGETDVPPAGTMFDRAQAALPHGVGTVEVDPRPFRQILGGEMAGLHVSGMDVEYSGGYGSDVLAMSGRLARHDGTEVGTFTVTFRRRDDGEITAYHDYLWLHPSEQGSGFANEYGMRLLQWYRDSGVNKMTLHANIDVGGYAWARMGFNWTNAGEVDRISDRLGGIVQTSVPRAQFRGAPNPDEQVRLGRELLGRMRQARTLDQYPTPYEISQLGRWDGAGRDDMWVGKALLLGSSWHGTLTLSEVDTTR